MKKVKKIWRPVGLDGSDFLRQNFEGLYRGEDSVISKEKVFDENLGHLSFLVHRRDASGRTIGWNEQYFLFPESK